MAPFQYSKPAKNPAWLDEMPCSDPGHKHINPDVEATARKICDLPKVCIARKVDGRYQECAEHQKSVTVEMVEEIRLKAKEIIEKEERAERVTGREEGLERIEEANERDEEAERKDEASERAVQLLESQAWGDEEWVLVGDDEDNEDDGTPLNPWWNLDILYSAMFGVADNGRISRRCPW